MSRARLYEFPSTGAMAQAAADRFARAASEAIAQRGRFVAVVPGGSTPRRVFAALTAPPYFDAIDWARVHLVPGDERMVPPSHHDSNSRMIQEALFEGLGPNRKQCNFYPPTLEAGLTPEEVALRWEARLRELFTPAQLLGGFPVFDFALLGIGSDGHTASLFPGDPALEETTRWCVAIEPGGKPAVARTTLTLPVLSHARAVCFIAAGSEKSALIKRIVSAGKPMSEFPASQVASPGEISWLIA